MEAWRELVEVSRWLYRLGYMPGTSGNLSVKLSDDRILATPTGCNKLLLKAVDMIVTEMDGHRAFLVPNHSAILLVNHGPVICGEGLVKCLPKMETLEHFSHIWPD